MKKTKIVATIGPKSESQEVLKKLSEAGVNIFRLNFSHGTHEEHGRKIDIIRNLNLKGAVMLDTKGPEIRTGEVRDKIFLKIGDVFTMTIDKGVYEDTGKISVNYKEFLKDVNVGDTIVFDSGVMLAKAIKKEGSDIVFEVVEGQTNITTKRHINLFGKPVSLPTITEQDWKDIDFGIEKKVDMIALSFVRSGKDINEVREYCKAKGHGNVQIISKIENFESTQNLEEIIIESDGIMVARGDLACEIPFSKVPSIQKKIVALCSFYKKPVIIATQMLLSMVENIQPTRAEVSDVANAVFESVDAVMTSDETTKGIDPVNVIKTMSKIVIDTEKEIYGCCCNNCCCGEENEKCNCENDDDTFRQNSLKPSFYLLDEYVEDTDAIVVISNNIEYTNSISKLRLNKPIISFIDNKTLCNNLNLVWNVEPEICNLTKEWKENIEQADKILKEKYSYIKKYILIFDMDNKLTIQIK